VAKTRDSAYYIKRLEKEHPALYAEVRSKKLTVHAACAKAGLIRLPSRLDALKREWRGASAKEQVEFVKWLKAGAPAIKAAPVADAAGRLTPAARAFLRDWVTKNKSRPGRILKAIGFKGFDWTLSAAIKRGDPLRSEVIPKLADWLAKQGFRSARS